MAAQLNATLFFNMGNSNLESAMTCVSTEVAAMRRCVETRHKFMDALKHASTFLNELRSSTLNPKEYYELYILVYDGLDHLSGFLESSHSNNHLVDLYELVQYAGNIIPRLYLMITIGSLYLKVEGSPKLEIINDMLEMCKGVQHPIRGLFLRYYLNQRTKDFLPLGTKEEIDQSIQFIISNFIEMNKLWVRLQFQGPLSERSKRSEERNELKILVGSNLVKLSQMDFIDKEYYRDTILPLLLEQIIKCNDKLAQIYLLDVIVQIFPDNYQIVSSSEFLNCLLQIAEGVDISPIVISLIDRLIDYKKNGNDNGEFTNESFNNFLNFAIRLNGQQLSIINKIMHLSMIYFPDDFKSLNELFKLLSGVDTPIDSSCKDLLLTPIEFNVMNFFKLDECYFKLFESQSLLARNEIMISIIKSFIKNGVKITKDEELNIISKFLSISILASEDPSHGNEEISETKKDLFGLSESNNNDDLSGSNTMDIEYEYLDKLLHLINPEEPIDKFKMINELTPVLKSGKFDLIAPTIVSIFVQLIRVINTKLESESKIEEKKEEEEDTQEETIEKMPTLTTTNPNSKILIPIFTKISELINDVKVKLPMKSIKLNLMAGEMSNECKMTNISYEFFIESFIIYEELLIESKVQYSALCIIMNKLMNLDELIKYNIEDFDKLITKAAIYGSRLLKKTDQCRSVYNASHLWWIIKEVDDGDNVEHIPLKRDEKRVLECLQKSLRIADSIMDFNVKVELFIEILNQSIYYFIHGNEMINVRYLNGLIELIWNNFKEMGIAKDSNLNSMKHFNRTLKYIKDQRSIDPRFLDLVLS